MGSISSTILVDLLTRFQSSDIMVKMVHMVLWLMPKEMSC